MAQVTTPSYAGKKITALKEIDVYRPGEEPYPGMRGGDWVQATFNDGSTAMVFMPSLNGSNPVPTIKTTRSYEEALKQAQETGSVNLEDPNLLSVDSGVPMYNASEMKKLIAEAKANNVPVTQQYASMSGGGGLGGTLTDIQGKVYDVVSSVGEAIGDATDSTMRYAFTPVTLAFMAYCTGGAASAAVGGGTLGAVVGGAAGGLVGAAGNQAVSETKGGDGFNIGGLAIGALAGAVGGYLMPSGVDTNMVGQGYSDAIVESLDKIDPNSPLYNTIQQAQKEIYTQAQTLANQGTMTTEEMLKNLSNQSQSILEKTAAENGIDLTTALKESMGDVATQAAQSDQKAIQSGTATSAATVADTASTKGLDAAKTVIEEEEAQNGYSSTDAALNKGAGDVAPEATETTNTGTSAADAGLYTHQDQGSTDKTWTDILNDYTTASQDNTSTGDATGDVSTSNVSGSYSDALNETQLSQLKDNLESGMSWDTALKAALLGTTIAGTIAGSTNKTGGTVSATSTTSSLPSYAQGDAESLWNDFIDQTYGTGKATSSLQNRLAQDATYTKGVEDTYNKSLTDIGNTYLDASKQAASTYQDLLKSSLSDAQSGTGLYTPTTVNVNGNKLFSFVPNSNRTLANSMLSNAQNQSTVSQGLADLANTLSTANATRTYQTSAAHTPNEAANSYYNALKNLATSLVSGNSTTTQTAEVPAANSWSTLLSGLNTVANLYKNLYGYTPTTTTNTTT